MILRPTYDIIEMTLATPPVANELTYHISYRGNGEVDSKFGFSEGTGNKALIPPQPFFVTVQSIIITNTDTASADVIIQIASGTFRTKIFFATLLPGESLQYDGTRFILPEVAGGGSGGGCTINNYPGVGSVVKQDYVSGEAIDAGQAVFVDTDGLLYIMDITNPTHYGKCIGVAESTVIAGIACVVITHGYTAQIGSGWTAGDIYYIDTTAFLVNTPPIIGWSQQIGVGVDTDIISIDLGTGIEII